LNNRDGEDIVRKKAEKRQWLSRGEKQVLNLHKWYKRGENRKETCGGITRIKAAGGDPLRDVVWWRPKEKPVKGGRG